MEGKFRVSVAERGRFLSKAEILGVSCDPSIPPDEFLSPFGPKVGNGVENEFPGLGTRLPLAGAKNPQNREKRVS